MNDYSINALITPIAYVIFVISTVFFMRRGGYSWIAAALTGLFSPLAYIILFAVVLLPLSLIVGKLGISNERLSSNLLSLLVAIFIVVAWCACGFLFSRRRSRHQPPPSANKHV